MKKANEKQIINIINYALPMFIVVLSFVTIIILYYEKSRFFEQEKNDLKKEYIEKNRLLIKDYIDNIYDYILTEQKTTEEALIKDLKEQIKNAHAIATSLYEQNKNKSKEEIEKTIVNALKNIRFNDGRGYFFIYDKSGKNIMLPPNPAYEGLDFIDYIDIKGKPIVKIMIDELKTKDEIVLDWHWYKPEHMEIQLKKIGIAVNFNELNWFIGTGEYVEDYENKIKEKVLNYIEKIKFSKNGYIFIFDDKPKYLYHVKKELINKNVLKENDTKDIKDVVYKLIEASKSGDFVNYVQNIKPDGSLAIKKTSYVRNIKPWSWVIGTGFYDDDIEEEIKIKKDNLEEKFEQYIKSTLAFGGILTGFFIILSLSFSKRLEKLFKRYNKEIDKQIDKNNQQTHILAQQSKMAAMGEMIGNIAHQWRQPLSAITSSASFLKLKKELGTLNDKDTEDTLNSIMNSANYLSSTIDDFRNFFSPNKNKTEFKSSELIAKLENFTKNDYKRSGIQIIHERVDDFYLNTYENELLQVILNMFNNSKDEFEKIDSNEKYIFISFYKNDNETIIEIKDNANGIDEKIINRIFEPYFTTKHKSKGTGIGLYMSLEIVKKHLEGNITVENIEYTYNSNNYRGVLFKIIL